MGVNEGYLMIFQKSVPSPLGYINPKGTLTLGVLSHGLIHLGYPLPPSTPVTPYGPMAQVKSSTIDSNSRLS